MGWLSGCKREVMLAVHEDEAAAYHAAYPRASIMRLSDKCRGHAGRVRREIMSRERDPFFFVDDDIYARLVHVKTHDAMFDVVERHLLRGGMPMAGIGKQIFSQGLIAQCATINGDPHAVRDKFVSTVYGIQPKMFDDCPLEKLRVYEDVALIVHAIRQKGTIVTFCATHTNKTPPSGGCNSWRTEKVVLESLDALVGLYPDVCKKIPTKHTAHNHALGVGVRVSWSKIRPRGES